MDRLDGIIASNFRSKYVHGWFVFEASQLHGVFSSEELVGAIAVVQSIIVALLSLNGGDVLREGSLDFSPHDIS